MKTITALATAKGICAIHIIRLSGDQAFEIISHLANQTISKVEYAIDHVKLYDQKNNLIDDVLLMKFVAPKSFTGEDLIEINCHGSDLIVQKILAALITAGATLAEHGEFSKRALLNNKMNAVQLFAMNNFIHSSNDLAMKFALQTMLNQQTKHLEKNEEELFKIIGRMEVLIDYPEFVDDNKEQITSEFLIKFFTNMQNLMHSLILDARIMLPVYEGINVAIVGVANAGKSSLLNKLIKTDKAIVSNIPGTTRDVVEAYLNLDNNLLKLHDTAGIHETLDQIEQIGIKKSKEVIAKASFVLFVVDGSSTKDYVEELQIYELIRNKPHLIVINKADLSLKTQWKGLKISTLDDSYLLVIEELKKLLRQLNQTQLQNKYTLQDEKQLNLALVLEKDFANVKESLMNGLSFDLIIDDLHRILDKFQQLIGKTTDLNFVDRLFKNFCVGK